MRLLVMSAVLLGNSSVVTADPPRIPAATEKQTGSFRWTKAPITRDIDQSLNTSYKWYRNSRYIRHQLRLIDQMIKDGAYEKADNRLERLRRINAMKEQDAALIWQYKANVAYHLSDTDSFTYASRQVLNYRKYISPELRLNILHALAKIYYEQGKSERAQDLMQRYERDAGSEIKALPLKLISELHYVQAELPEALSDIQEALGKDQGQISGAELFDLYDLKLSTELEMGSYGDALDTLDVLLVSWPTDFHCELAAGTLMRQKESVPATDALGYIKASYPACAEVTDVIIP